MRSNLTPEVIELVADRFRLLSEGIRLRIVNCLENGEMSVTELARTLGATQPNISKHLKMLAASGIVRREQRGNAVYYSVADESIFELCDVVCGSLAERLKERASLFANA